ncbi:protein of unknown function (plasmid) [Citrobacter freundii]|nr:protein of unknown function [Citrobacter freundii]
MNENPLNHIIPLHKIWLSAIISFLNAAPERTVAKRQMNQNNCSTNSQVVGHN